LTSQGSAVGELVRGMKLPCISVLLEVACFSLVFAGCSSQRMAARKVLPERRVVQAGMTLPEVVGVLGTHYKKCNHSLVGHYTLVYDGVAVRIRDGRVYDIEPSSGGWIEMMKDVPYG